MSQDQEHVWFPDPSACSGAKCITVLVIDSDRTLLGF